MELPAPRRGDRDPSAHVRAERAASSLAIPLERGGLHSPISRRSSSASSVVGASERSPSLSFDSHGFQRADAEPLGNLQPHLWIADEPPVVESWEVELVGVVEARDRFPANLTEGV